MSTDAGLPATGVRVFLCGPDPGPRLTYQQRRALAFFRARRGWHRVAVLARALDTSEAGAARTASSLVARGLVDRNVHRGHTYYCQRLGRTDG